MIWAIIMSVISNIAPSDAAQEMINRRHARESLLGYAQYVNPDYEIAHVHRVLAEKLEAVERGDITRLMITMPPRHGKSLESSQIFPCWYLGKHPGRNVVQSGYGLDIAKEHSRLARDIFSSNKHANIFPDSHHEPGAEGQNNIDIKKQAAQLWRTSKGGSYYACGVGGSLTGRGADLLIIDDPIKNRDEAESPVQRKNVLDWYRSTAYTRLSPIGAVIIIMTRWHQNDLAGHLLKEMGDGKGDDWDVVNFPAISDNGEALWPERYPVERLLKIKAVLGAYEWSALYDQQPVQRGGNLFKVDRIKWHKDDSEFPDVTYSRGWDLASTIKERTSDDPDYTASAKVAVTFDDDIPSLWIKDTSAFQAEATERNARIVRTAVADGPSVHQGIESVAGYKDAYTTIRDVLQGVSTVTKITQSKDKVVRLSALEPIFEAGNVHVLIQPGNDIFLQQFTEFPAGSHDDIPDAVTIAYDMHKTPKLFEADRKSFGF